MDVVPRLAWPSWRWMALAPDRAEGQSGQPVATTVSRKPSERVLDVAQDLGPLVLGEGLQHHRDRAGRVAHELQVLLGVRDREGERDLLNPGLVEPRTMEQRLDPLGIGHREQPGRWGRLGRRHVAALD